MLCDEEDDEVEGQVTRILTVDNGSWTIYDFFFLDKSDDAGSHSLMECNSVFVSDY